MKISIGIDPGKSGGVSVIWDKGGVFSIPYDDMEFIELIQSIDIYSASENIPFVCCVEKVGAMPGQGVNFNVQLRKISGLYRGSVASVEHTYQLIPPRKWKKEYSLEL